MIVGAKDRNVPSPMPDSVLYARNSQMLLTHIKLWTASIMISHKNRILTRPNISQRQLDIPAPSPPPRHYPRLAIPRNTAALSVIPKLNLSHFSPSGPSTATAYP
jgi:hypothetical protein